MNMARVLMVSIVMALFFIYFFQQAPVLVPSGCAIQSSTRIVTAPVESFLSNSSFYRVMALGSYGFYRVMALGSYRLCSYNLYSYGL